MTVTKRKPTSQREGDGLSSAVPAAANGDAGSGQGKTIESGMRYNCDVCSCDVTHTVRVRCAEEKEGHVHREHAGGKEDRDALVCPDFDLCVPCFLTGSTLGRHRPTHAYRIISSHAFPIFSPTWGADEELLLIEGCQLYGLGNWADVAEHVGGRTKVECESHYEEVYLGSEEWPAPPAKRDFSSISPASFQTHKKARLEAFLALPLPLPPPKPLASAPTCHEVGGYMPGRLEFENEYENEAETLIKDLEFGWVGRWGGEDMPATLEEAQVTGKKKEQMDEDSQRGAEEREHRNAEKTRKDEKASSRNGSRDPPPKEKDEAEPEASTSAPPAKLEVDSRVHSTTSAPEEDPVELELKLSLMEMFNERYDRRVWAKEVIWDRGLMNYKTMLATERKKPKEERDLLQRCKVFARIQTKEDHEQFTDGLLFESALRKRIAELQQYRRMGVCTFSEAEVYEKARSSRSSSKSAYRDLLGSSHRTTNNGPKHPLSHSTTMSSSGVPRPTGASVAGPLTLANAGSVQLLTPLEQDLCATLRLLPGPYLFLKSLLLREYVRKGGHLSRFEARRVVGGKTSVVGVGGERFEEADEEGEKVERVWEFLVRTGGLDVPEEQKQQLKDEMDAEGGEDQPSATEEQAKDAVMAES